MVISQRMQLLKEFQLLGRATNASIKGCNGVGFDLTSLSLSLLTVFSHVINTLMNKIITIFIKILHSLVKLNKVRSYFSLIYESFQTSGGVNPKWV